MNCIREHAHCSLHSQEAALLRLTQLVRSRLGWGLVLGDAGSGKTVLADALCQKLNADPVVLLHRIESPVFKSEFQFLRYLVKAFQVVPPFKSTLDFKEAFKKFLYEKTVGENKTVVLLIDESHSLSLNILEVLRSLLHYEHRGAQLLTLVMFSQVDILSRIKRIAHLPESIALKYTLNALDEDETMRLMEYTFRECGFHGTAAVMTDEAFSLAYRHTKGVPEAVVKFCLATVKAAKLRPRPTMELDTRHACIPSCRGA